MHNLGSRREHPPPPPQPRCVPDPSKNDWAASSSHTICGGRTKLGDQRRGLLCLSLGFVEIPVLHSLSSSFGSAVGRRRAAPSAQHFVIDSARLQSSASTEDRHSNDFCFPSLSFNQSKHTLGPQQLQVECENTQQWAWTVKRHRRQACVSPCLRLIVTGISGFIV